MKLVNQKFWVNKWGTWLYIFCMRWEYISKIIVWFIKIVVKYYLFWIIIINRFRTASGFTIIFFLSLIVITQLWFKLDNYFFKFHFSLSMWYNLSLVFSLLCRPYFLTLLPHHPTERRFFSPRETWFLIFSLLHCLSHPVDSFRLAFIFQKWFNIAWNS